MNIWDKVKEGIDKAGKAAQDVIDDGKTRLDAYRAREQADKAAEAVGYALFRAAELGQEVEEASRERLMRSLRERDTEARRLEAILAAETANQSTEKPTEPPPPPAAGMPAEPVPQPPTSPSAASPPPPTPPAAASPPPSGADPSTGL